tara:strand:+ start:66 stop:452 length:387 start_codon:yes stop_codon:yes gene_type:complete
MPSRNSIPYRVTLLEGYVGYGVTLTGTSTPSLAVTGTSTISGTNTGDNAINSLYSGLAASKQDTLVSGTNIKTINGSSVLGSGNLVVTGSGAAWGSITGTLSSQTDLQTEIDTLNNNSIAYSIALGGI